MKIMLINNLGHLAGGAEKCVFLLQQGLRREGHEVMVLTTDKSPTDKPVYADVMVPGIRARGVSKFIKYSWDEAGRRRIAKHTTAYQPDIIHIHNIGEFSPSVLWAFPKNIPVIMTVHGPEGFVKKLLPWQLPASDYRQHSYNKSDLKLIGRLRMLYFLGVQRPLFLLGFRRVRLLTAPSAFMTTILHADFSPKKLKHMPYGIEAMPQGARGESKTILFVGRVEAVKGIHTLIEAMDGVIEKIPDARLVIVGDGAERKVLEQQAAKKHADAIHFAGWVQADDVFPYYHDAAVVVVPSVWPENFPFVAMQALGTGRALVGSRVGGIPELIEEGKNGYVVPPNDPQALAQALCKVLEGDAAIRMGEHSAKLAKRYSFEPYMKAMNTLYAGFLNK